MNSNTEKPFSPIDFLKIFSKTHVKTTVILLYAVFALTFWKYLPTYPLPADLPQTGNVLEIPAYTDAVNQGLAMESENKEIPLSLFLAGELKIFSSFLFMGLIPIGIIKWGFREKLSDYGLSFERPKLILFSICVFTPLMFLLAHTTSLSNYASVYPFNPLAAHASGGRLVLHLVLYFFFFYFSWEFMFRGFILKGLIPECGLFPAILIQAIAAAMIHYGHPLSETLGCIGGSVFWGTVVIRTKSIVPTWIHHSTLGLTLDYLIITRIG